MNEDGFTSLDDIDDDLLEQFECEMKQEKERCKEIESYLWKKAYMGYNVMPYNGLIFITNKTKTKHEQLKWLRKYSEVLRTYGIDAKVYDDRHEAYICF